MVDAFLAVESRVQSSCCVCAMGCARVGVECVSEHSGKFGDSSRSSGGHGRGCVVGDKEGVRRRYKGHHRRGPPTQGVKHSVGESSLLIRVCRRHLANGRFFLVAVLDVCGFLGELLGPVTSCQHPVHIATYDTHVHTSSSSSSTPSRPGLC